MSIQDDVHSELLTILFRQTKHMIWAEAFAATLILFILWWPTTVNHAVLAGWYMYMLAITLPRFLLAKAYDGQRPTAEQSYRWQRFIMVMLFFSALGWSFAGTMLLPPNNVLNQALILFLLIGVAATANPFYSPIKKVYAVFLIPTLLPTAAVLFWQGTNLEIFLGIALITFAVLMLTTAIVSSGLISAALTYRFQNMKLAQDLLKTNEVLELMATHDTLTSLPNRQMCNTMLVTALASARIHHASLYVMFLDIDKFKKINDTLGHDVGDALLMTVAQRLNENFCGAGRVSRLGGDEFIVILDRVTGKDQVMQLAETCCMRIALPIEIDERVLHVTTSIGISTYPQDGGDAEALVTHADMAMYLSKRKGGNCFHFYNGLPIPQTSPTDISYL